MHKGFRRHGGGGRDRRGGQQHCVAALDGKTARADVDAARKSRKVSLAAAAARKSRKGPLAAACLMILDNNTPGLLLNPQILAEIGKDGVIRNVDVGGIVPERVR